MKAYQVADEPQLRALARVRPSTLEAFRKGRLEGWGELRVQKHGQAFVACLAAKCAELQLATDVYLLRPPPASSAFGAGGAGASAPLFREVKWTESLAKTYAAFMDEQRSVHAIATDRPKPIKEATVRSYLATAAMTGRPVDWDRLNFPSGLVAAVQRAMEALVARARQQPPAAESAGGGPVGPEQLEVRDILRLVPDYWNGQESSWGDVEAARVCLLQRHYQMRLAAPTTTGGGGGGGGDMRSPAGAAVTGGDGDGGGSGSGSTGGSAQVGAWLTTRKRASPAAATGAASAAGGGGGGGSGFPAKKVYQPGYLAQKAPKPAAAAAAASPAAAAGAAVASSSSAPAQPPQQPPATPRALVTALGGAPQGLTKAELEARLGGGVGSCLASLQEEMVVYQSGDRFLLL